jgi:hypothetical protein
VPDPRQARTDQRDNPESTDATLAAEPTLSRHNTEPADPTDRIEPADPIDKMEPADPIDKIEPLDPIDRIEPDEPLCAPGLVAMGPVWQVSALRRQRPPDGRRSVGHR